MEDQADQASAKVFRIVSSSLPAVKGLSKYCLTLLPRALTSRPLDEIILIAGINLEQGLNHGVAVCSGIIESVITTAISSLWRSYTPKPSRPSTAVKTL